MELVWTIASLRPLARTGVTWRVASAHRPASRLDCPLPRALDWHSHSLP